MRLIKSKEMKSVRTLNLKSIATSTKIIATSDRPQVQRAKPEGHICTDCVWAHWTGMSAFCPWQVCQRGVSLIAK